MQAEGFNLFRGEIWMVHPDGLCTQTCLAMLVAASYPSLYEPTFYLCPSLKGMSDEIYCPLIVRSEPRCVLFCNYDSSTPPSPTVIKLFQSSIDNSFKDRLTRTPFLNQFYQCWRVESKIRGRPHGPTY